MAMIKQKQHIKILYLNDSNLNTDNVVCLLKKDNSVNDIKIIDSKTDYKKALTNFAPEIIICDTNLASFNSMEALKILKQSGLNIPFILIANDEQEEHAITMLENGAHDYLINDRLQRLPFAITNALEKNRLEKEDLKIKKSEDKYRSFFENSIDGILLAIPDGHIFAANPAACAIFQMTEVEICKVGRIGLVDVTDERLMKFINERQRTGKAKGEITLIRKDGEKFPGELTSTMFRDVYGEERTCMIIRDISEGKNAELERTKITADLVQHGKKLEQFNYIVSHNLRAPIANILGLSNVLKGNISDTERNKMQHYLFAAVEQLDTIVKDLNYILQIKTEITENRESVYLPELVSNIKSSIQNVIEKENVHIVTDFTVIDNVPLVKSYIHSIFYNLILNSIKYKHPDKNPIITIKSEIDNDKMRISFKDNGSGIDLKQHGDKIFGLYKRFHPHIEGRGLGLFMTKTQIEVLGGIISIKSEPNIGTEFIIELPL